ncbi:MULTISPECIES: hypothetical protein [Halobacteriales]|jgi:hypothetical protein|uniref:hypothetical protein n=1 Tax=Halobacteriales TaxID=2235 RepID=UPI000EF14BB1|nr:MULTISPECIES: hypothetical protein [Halobacteria]QKY18494.1 hypothetical protein Hrr1229_016330 [Halorubrum sp. CBA1229]RLM89498.1 hypothetical protein D3D01_19170 [Haloarcula sp. Atlit-7R]
MPNEWKVLERAVDRFELDPEQRQEYVRTITEVYGEAMATRSEFEEFGEEYYSFLNREVFSDDRVISTLSSFGLSEEQLAAFHDGTVASDELVKTWNELRFRIDELIDFAMLLKLVKDYGDRSDTGMIESRYRLQKLVYLVNRRIAQQDDYAAIGELEGDLGMLDRTGYRYRFTKRSSGPFSSDVYEDKNRLFAWQLIEEPVIGQKGTGEVGEHERRYGVELAPAGEIMVNEFYDRIEHADSMMLSSWNYAQQTVIDEIAHMTHDDFVQYISEGDRLQKASTGAELLVGPRRKFKANEIEFLDELTGEFAHA